MSKLFESVMKDAATFYDMVQNELHGLKDVQVYSDEPFGDSVSCFDFNGDGDDQTDEERSSLNMFKWDHCELTMDDDGLYWKSRSGITCSLLIYTVVKAVLKPNHIRLWIAPKDSSEDMGVVDFYTKESK